MSVAVYTSVRLEPVTCYECGVIFGLPEDLHNNLLANHKTFYCPSGHGQHFIGETEAQKFKRLYNDERDRSAALRGERDGLENSLRATRGHVTRLRRRVVAGACPFGCRRHFADLERHVHSKHPGQTLEGE